MDIIVSSADTKAINNYSNRGTTNPYAGSTGTTTRLDNAYNGYHINI